jgi:hypothetical protein
MLLLQVAEMKEERMSLLVVVVPLLHLMKNVTYHLPTELEMNDVEAVAAVVVVVDVEVVLMKKSAKVLMKLAKNVKNAGAVMKSVKIENGKEKESVD